jgi:hypothetical protein
MYVAPISRRPKKRALVKLNLLMYVLGHWRLFITEPEGSWKTSFCIQQREKWNFNGFYSTNEMYANETNSSHTKGNQKLMKTLTAFIDKLSSAL